MHLGCGEKRPPNDDGVPTSSTPREVADLDDVRRLLAIRDYAGAQRSLSNYLDTHPEKADGFQLAGELAERSGEFETAILLFQRARELSSESSWQLDLRLAGVYVADARPFDAVETLERTLKTHPNQKEVRQNLVSYLAQVGLQDQADQHMRWLVQRKHGSQSVLVILSDLTRPQTVKALCEQALKQHPEDLRPQYSLALFDVAYSRWKQVAEKLEPVVRRHPMFLPAVALYGRTLVELNDADSIQQWSSSLPEGIEETSEYWMAAGNWASRLGRHQAAARAFWMAVRLNENNPESLTQLATELRRLGRQQDAKLATERAQTLVALRGHVDQLASWRFNSQQTVFEVATTLRALGRPWEAVNWMMLGYSMSGSLDPNFQESFKRMRAEVTGSTPWQLDEMKVSNKIDLSDYPAISWAGSDSSSGTDIAAGLHASLRLRDEAAERSLKHLCDIGKSSPDESGMMIYQSGSGGAGVVDYNLDGWPDLYLTKMDGTPGKQDSQTNHLYLNLSGQFDQVTGKSMLVDHGYSQGVAVGDFNADGWPDVMVGNIGRNRLFQNNGDGTFRDVTDMAGLDGDGWTTSVAFADLNADGHADLYEVGYCRGEDALTQPCIHPIVGEARACNPMAFDPEPDRIWAGKGDGTFDEKTQWLGEHGGGRGFGLVIGDFDHQVGLETYVANDMTANHFWASPADGDFRLSDQASIRGLAFNRRSAAQASMGIAAADADNDGDIDFLLTHFSSDHNTYYRQDRPGVWSDESRVAGFDEPSRPLLGFGTQWIDIDNDGHIEIVIANGHVDDFTFRSRAFRQPTQVFAAVSLGQWQPVARESLGDYFAKDRLARAVATLDADRDGKMDLIVTHLYDPVALLMNRSTTDFKQLRVFCRATKTHRDAIGTRVRFSVGDQTYQQQLIAGNGFQCSNEACIVFGVGHAKTLTNAEVAWPDGSTESLGALISGKDYLVVQGQGATLLQ